MPKRWKVAAEVTLTDPDGQEKENEPSEKDYDTEAKARKKFEKVTGVVKKEMESETDD